MPGRTLKTASGSPRTEAPLGIHAAKSTAPKNYKIAASFSDRWAITRPPSRLITLGQLADCLRHHPEVAATWPHHSIDRLSDLIDEPEVIDLVKSHRRLVRVRHRDGREWSSIKAAAQDLRVHKKNPPCA